MAKRTAVIDIGSNSARLVIFEQSSRYGFHLICEQKSKVRIGEGAYRKEGSLQPVGIKRAFFALHSFLYTLNRYQVDKTLCVATSALRDAPNRDIFVNWIRKELGLTIRVIDGKEEAALGAIAAVNLLPLHDAVTIDIGGGSSDMALIRNGQIIDTFSLNLGTVRLKELFFDTTSSLRQNHADAVDFIRKELQTLPETFKHTLAVGIGGTARTLSKSIMKQHRYPLEKLHAFTYDIQPWQAYFKAISQSSAKGLKKFNVKKSRYDTIREGTLVFSEILSHIGATRVINSAVGVREGVFLKQMLADEGLSFPKEINPSVISLLDRFYPPGKPERNTEERFTIASKLYRTLQKEIREHPYSLEALRWALKLSHIGETLNIYHSHETAFYIAMKELNYGFTHEEIVLISSLLRMHGKNLLYTPVMETYADLLPEHSTLRWLSFIYTLTLFLHEHAQAAHIDFCYRDNVLTVLSDQPLYLAREKIKKLEKPAPFAIQIKAKEEIPENPLLGV